MKGILVGSGNYFSKERFFDEIKDSDILIAIDGGMEWFSKLNINPNILIGDLDSISKKTLEELRSDKGLIIKKHPKEKDSTDMELGIDYLISNNCKEIIIFGGTGTRLDHTLANIFLLDKLNKKNIKGKIIDKNNTILIIDNNYEMKKELGKYISIIPITELGSTISLEGFKYDLNNYSLKFGSTMGVSNEIVDEKAYINVVKGKVVLFISSD